MGAIGLRALETKRKQSTNDISQADLITLPKIADPRGSISYVHPHQDCPFDIRRVYYLYDVPSGGARGGHAHKELTQLMIAVSGSFNISLFDGYSEQLVTLDRPDVGLLIRPGYWRELDNFSSGAVCLVLASHAYDESDYFRDKEQFIQYVQSRNQ